MFAEYAAQRTFEHFDPAQLREVVCTGKQRFSFRKTSIDSIEGFEQTLKCLNVSGEEFLLLASGRDPERFLSLLENLFSAEAIVALSEVYRDESPWNFAHKCILPLCSVYEKTHATELADIFLKAFSRWYDPDKRLPPDNACRVLDGFFRNLHTDEQYLFIDKLVESEDFRTSLFAAFDRCEYTSCGTIPLVKRASFVLHFIDYIDMHASDSQRTGRLRPWVDWLHLRLRDDSSEALQTQGMRGQPSSTSNKLVTGINAMEFCNALGRRLIAQFPGLFCSDQIFFKIFQGSFKEGAGLKINLDQDDIPGILLMAQIDKYLSDRCTPLSAATQEYFRREIKSVERQDPTSNIFFLIENHTFSMVAGNSSIIQAFLEKYGYIRPK